MVSGLMCYHRNVGKSGLNEMDTIAKKIRNYAIQHVYMQCVISVALALFLLALFGQQIAWLFMLGALTCIIPNFYFATRFCRQTGAQHAKQIMLDIYKAEFFKLVLTGAIFGLIFMFIDVTIAPIFTGFICAQASFWVSGSILRLKQRL